ncbi:Iron(III) dicitrate transport system, periplasmic iron-binding protein FecB (TC 3.A.1.14.1) [plant metagenome]|uniref:Iron(III) dicitrate transport system, periplasmic iron-binding protein FecB (TC 3.A.1.14.1) n=1 Tax=plant metagenome TaxID=1297885 RepID=A0A484UZ60_9ZZZZ
MPGDAVTHGPTAMDGLPRTDRRRLLLGAAGLCLAAPWPTRAAQARTVGHALGDTTLTGQPSRVITLFQGATDAALALGVRPVGVVESWTEKPVYRYLRERLPAPALVGLETQPSLEDVVYLMPDLIVASRFRNERIYGLLSRIAATVAAEDVYDFRATTALVGAALGREAQADALLAAFEQEARALGATLAARHGAQWPMRASVIEFREDHVRAYLPDSFSGGVLDTVGFGRTRVQAGERGPLRKLGSHENIPFLDADVIFVLMRMRTAAVQRNLDAWQRHPLWQRLAAVRAGRVFPVDNVVWNLSGGILAAQGVCRDVRRLLASAESS